MSVTWDSTWKELVDAPLTALEKLILPEACRQLLSQKRLQTIGDLMLERALWTMVRAAADETKELAEFMSSLAACFAAPAPSLYLRLDTLSGLLFRHHTFLLEMEGD